MLPVETIALGDLMLTIIVTRPPWYENCYLVRHQPTGAQIVIDPGDDAGRIIARIQADGGQLQAILLTHGHPDHIGAVRAIQDMFGVPCAAHRNEEPVISAAPTLGSSLMGSRTTAPDSCQYFGDAPALSLGGRGIRVIETPGHTPGGVCYAFDGFVITGDTLFNQGVGRTDLPGGNGPQLMASITRLLEDLPDDTLVFPGHGPYWTIGEARVWWKWVR